MASAAPSSSSEAGAHVRRGRNDKEDPCIKNPAVDARSTYRHATKTMGLLADGDIPWPSSLESPAGRTLPLSSTSRRVFLFVLPQKLYTMAVIYRSLKMTVRFAICAQYHPLLPS
ncbi:hypothetical protein PSTG_05886 [Puccinia striiformis f. sp. tritici PST-78]|uniref:Uncharacterized protein n=1 Tax=Puccinia striiformis f. sp. tritici PST-78 TaxID=1165861 RepID=A0A0L0VP76_9BASI|nr:hypothetical protein PSTG_05886 [Puccinia striiformis f. sp. tritici PST-78]